MNILKALFLATTLFLYIDLEFSVIYAMEDIEKTEEIFEPEETEEYFRAPEENPSTDSGQEISLGMSSKPDEESDENMYDNSWQALIYELSKKKECSSTEWLDDAIEYATELIEEDNETIDFLAGKLDTTIRALCGDTETNRIIKRFRDALVPQQEERKEQEEDIITTSELQTEDSPEQEYFLQPEEPKQTIQEQIIIQRNQELESKWLKCLDELSTLDNPIVFEQAVQKAHQLAKQMGISIGTSDDELKNQFTNAIELRTLKKNSDPLADKAQNSIQTFKTFNEDLSQNVPQEEIPTNYLPEVPLTEDYNPNQNNQSIPSEKISLPVYTPLTEDFVQKHIPQKEQQTTNPQQLAEQQKGQEAQAEQLAQRKKQLDLQKKMIEEQSIQQKALQQRQQETQAELAEQQKQLETQAEQQKNAFRIAFAEKIKTEQEAETKRGIISRLLGLNEEKKEVALPKPSELFTEFEKKLGEVSVEWLTRQYAPSNAWQTKISDLAIALLNNKEIETKDAFIMINKAMDDYDKTCWLHDSRKIALAKNTIFELIHSGINPEFATFLENFKAIAAEDFEKGKDSLSWKYSNKDSYYHLDSKASEAIAKAAAQLIGKNVVTEQELETMMNLELQELRKGKMRIRAIKELGLPGKIKDHVSVFLAQEKNKRDNKESNNDKEL